jgi:hypothetical protein
MRVYLLISALLLAIQSYSQTKVRFPIWTFNTKDTKVFGLALGLMATDGVQNVTSNGLRFELLGLGLFLPLIPEAPVADSDSLHYDLLKGPYAERINGINLSPIGHGCDCKVNGLNIYGFGSITGQVNGLSLGFLLSGTERINGVQMTGFFNFTYEVNGIQLAFISNRNNGFSRGVQISAHNRTKKLRGVQIGLFNEATDIKGIQIGLMNVNSKRAMPFFNF